MKNELALIVLKGYADRGDQLNKYINKFLDSKKDHNVEIINPRFSNGESKVMLNSSVRNKDVYIIADVGNHSITYNIYGNENKMSPDDHYVDIIRTISAIAGRASKITLLMPLMYQSRQHRRSGRESLDCAMALRYLESLGVNSIITFDVHDAEIQNTTPINSFDSVMPLYTVLTKFIENEKEHIGKDKMVVISPDTGAMERSRKYAGHLNLDIGLFYKRRDYTKVVNGKNPIVEHQYIGPDVKGKNILVIDDMLSSGESIIDLAQKLKAQGCEKIFVITTFAFFTNGYDKFDEMYKNNMLHRVYATNATYLAQELLQKPWFCEICLTKQIAQIMCLLNQNRSLKEIYEPSEEFTELIKSLK